MIFDTKYLITSVFLYIRHVDQHTRIKFVCFGQNTSLLSVYIDSLKFISFRSDQLSDWFMERPGFFESEILYYKFIETFTGLHLLSLTSMAT